MEFFLSLESLLERKLVHGFRKECIYLFLVSQILWSNQNLSCSSSSSISSLMKLIGEAANAFSTSLTLHHPMVMYFYDSPSIAKSLTQSGDIHSKGTRFLTEG